MIGSVLARMSYANVMSTVAVFAAIGGGAFAVAALPGSNGEIAACYDKRGGNQGEVRLLVKGGCERSERQIAWSQEGPPGAPGTPGIPGEDATNLFAWIQDHGTALSSDVAYGSGVTAVAEFNAAADDGAYTVGFNRSLEGCALQAIPGEGAPTTPGAGFIKSPAMAQIIDADDFETGVVDLNFIKADGNPTDTSFFISAFCP